VDVLLRAQISVSLGLFGELFFFTRASILKNRFLLHYLPLGRIQQGEAGRHAVHTEQATTVPAIAPLHCTNM